MSFSFFQWVRSERIVCEAILTAVLVGLCFIWFYLCFFFGAYILIVKYLDWKKS